MRHIEESDFWRLRAADWLTIATLIGGGMSGLISYLKGQSAEVAFIFALGAMGIIIIVGLLLLLAGPVIYRRFYPKRTVRRQRLYVYTQPDGVPRKKEYMAAWSPTDYFSTYFTSWVSWVGVEREDPQERHLTFYVLNPGPAAARHVKATWYLEGVNVAEFIMESGVFGESANRVEPHRVRLMSKTGWSDFPVSTQIQDVPTPVINVGETIQLIPPIAFTHALTVYALCEAHRLLKTVPNPLPIEEGHDLGAMAAYLEETHIRLRDITVELEYVSNAGPHRDKFHVIAWMRPLGAVRKPKPDQHGAYNLAEDAIGAWIDHIEVLPDETPRQT